MMVAVYLNHVRPEFIQPLTHVRIGHFVRQLMSKSGQELIFESAQKIALKVDILPVIGVEEGPRPRIAGKKNAKVYSAR